MKGQRVVWPNQATVEIEEFDIPPLGDNEVLAATECSLISPGTERAFLLGLPNAQGNYPSYPGYSNIGRVIDAGANVSDFDSAIASPHQEDTQAILQRRRIA